MCEIILNEVMIMCSFSMHMIVAAWIWTPV